MKSKTGDLEYPILVGEEKDLDHILATKLMEWELERLHAVGIGNMRKIGDSWFKNGYYLRRRDTWSPSTNAEHCLMAMEKMKKTHDIEITTFLDDDEISKWGAEVWQHGLDQQHYIVNDKSFTLAVTKAIVAALERNEK